MGNQKDYGALIDSLVERGKPFLIIKYCLKSLDRANSAYEIVTICGSKLRYMPIDRKGALEAISKYGLPLLHKVDNRNMIWGDEEFKKQFNKRKIEL